MISYFDSEVDPGSLGKISPSTKPARYAPNLF